ncbi:hybrid sensor histidine kinase/response regulator [Desulfolutivibrio sulfoxidireducens]|uniref:hybrid sensor histidine kinase/response regulator n=1 Tax=Desulfolutivibrio sulfoxidireducens TaxID=2773299 RepID=UPI00159DD186|nr:ATP-binding protein [Desulfolutivibrio sulfoxidireducens]
MTPSPPHAGPPRFGSLGRPTAVSLVLAAMLLAALTARADPPGGQPPGSVDAAPPVAADSGPPVRSVAQDQDHPTKKNVLYLNSYQPGYKWSDEIFDGIREVLANQTGHIVDLQVEYMDSKKYSDPVLRQALFDLYKYKFRDTSFSVVLVSDNYAFEFAAQYAAELFPGVPVVFCGVNDLRPDMLPDRADITGVEERFDLTGTLDLALALHPGKKRLIVIGDRSVTGIAIANQVRDQLPAYRDRLEWEFWDSYQLGEILGLIERVPADALIFFIPFYQAIGDRFYSAEEVVAEIGRHSDAPIYTCWDFLVGAGTVGGRVIPGREHGRLAASMALRILDGEKASDIPRVAPIGELFLFDYNGLERFHILESALPMGSEILNKPYYFFRIDPQIFWIIVVAMALLAATLVFLVINISRRRTVEEKIRAQLSFLTLLLDNIPQLVFWKDRDQRYQGANKAFAAFFGLTDPAQVVGKTNPEVLPGWWDHAGMAEEADREVMRSETPRRSMRLAFTRGDGDPAWLELNKVPLRDRKGQVVGTLSTAEDVTDKERLEARLRQSQKMEAVGTLAGGLAHDFNNILTTIINSTEMALLDLAGDSRAAADLRRVLSASRRGGGIVRQILTFSRPSRENFREADIALPIMEATGLVAATLPGNIRLETDIQVVSAVCRADPNQIHQVVMNLCANAYQALRGAGGTGGVIRVVLCKTRLSAEEGLPLDLPEGRYLRLTVADDGPGIAPEIIDNIFDPFFTTRKDDGGTGLGLAVVQGIARNHNGRVSVSSAPGKGASFTVHLPCAGAGDKTCEIDDPAAVRGTERVLFVEDDASLLETVPRVLCNLGYRVAAEPGADEALKALDKACREGKSGEAFDVVVTDFDMPGKNGFDLARTLSGLAPSLPVVVVSGRFRDVRGADRPPNVREILLKPYDGAALHAAIRRALGEGDGESCRTSWS